MHRYMSLKDHVYDYISEQINNGGLSHDDKISEFQISQTLNISRTPVREALISLAAEGYLEIVPRKGFHVKSATREKAAELYEIIGVLDGKAAFLAMGRISKREIEDMRFLIEAMDMTIEKQLYQKYNDLQNEFHDKYIDMCGNSELVDTLRKFRKHFIKKEYSIGEGEEMFEVLTDTNKEHREILGFFERGDREGVENYLKNVHWSVDKSRFEAR